MTTKYAKKIADFLEETGMTLEEFIAEVKVEQARPKLRHYIVEYSYTECDSEDIIAENEEEAKAKFYEEHKNHDDYLIEQIWEDEEVEDY